MGSPGAPTGFRVGIWTDAGWENITSDVLDRSGATPIDIEQRGIPDQGEGADPTKVTFQLLNSTSKVNPSVVGRYTTHNPNSDLYGVIGLYTPMRAYKPIASDDFDRTETSAWGTSSSGHAWTTVGGDAADYDVAAGAATIDVDTVDSQRLAVLDAAATDVEISASIKPGVIATGADITAGVMLRYADTATFYEVAVQFHPDQTMDLVIVRHAAGATTLATVALAGTYDAGTVMRVTAKVGNRAAITAKAWDTAGAEPYVWTLRASDNAAARIVAAGDTGIRAILAAGNTNTLPVTVTVSDVAVIHHRVNAEVTQWPPRWDVSGADVWVDAEAAGIMRRLGIAGDPVDTAARRYLAAQAPLGYWPLDDPESAVDGSAVTPGATTLATSYEVITATARFGQGSLAGWLGRALVLDDIVTLRASVPATDPDTTTFACAMRGRGRQSGADVYRAFGVDGPGDDGTSTFQYYLKADWNSGTPTLTLYAERSTSGGVVSLGTATSTQAQAGWDDQLHVWQIQVAEDGSDLDVTAWLDGQQIITGTHSSVDLAPIVGPLITNYQAEQSVFGHMAVWVGAAPSATDISDAVFGHQAEPAGRRLARFCDEESIPLITIGDLDDTELMGPQYPGDRLEVIDTCPAVDKGLMFEARDEVALVYRTRRSMYNQPATMALSYTSAGHIAPDLDPMPDDLQTDNIITVKRRMSGAEGTYEQTTGRHSTAQPPAGIGRHPVRFTLDLNTDAQTTQHAAWHATLTTVDLPRYAAVPLDADAAATHDATLLEQIHVLDVGDRMTIDDMPAWMPPDQVDLIALGFAETITLTRWEMTPNTTLAAVYQQVAAYGPYPHAAHEASGTTGSWSVTAPPGDLDGATVFLLHAVDVGGIADMGTPTGGTAWTLLHEAEDMDAGDGAARLWVKTAGDAEPASFGLTQDSGADGVAILAVVHGVDPTLLVSDFEASTSGSGKALPTPAVTMPVGGGLDLRFGALPSHFNPISAPPGFGLIAGGEVATDSVPAGFAARIVGAGDAGAADFTLNVAAGVGRFGATVLLPVPGGYSRYGSADAEIASGLRLDMSSGSEATCPDAAALDITGDLDIRADVTLETWGTVFQNPVSKWKNTLPLERQYTLAVTPSTLRLSWTEDGSTIIGRDSAELPWPPPSGRLAVRATLDVDNGAGGHTVTFYTAPTLAGPWTQFGDPEINAGTTSIATGSAGLQVGGVGGSENVSGLVHAVEVRDGIDGTIVASPDFDGQTAGTTSFDDAAGNTWTVGSGAQILGDFVAGTDTALHLHPLAGPAYARSLLHPACYPLDLRIAGARVRVTAMGKVIATVQEATVEATIVNGVTKTIPARTPVTDWARDIYGL